MTTQELLMKAGLIFVEIDGTGIKQNRTYTDKVTGAVKPLSDSQTGYVWQGGKYPAEIAIDIPQGSGPYRPGIYFLGGPIFSAGDFGRPNFKGFRELQLIDAETFLDGLALAVPKKAA